MDGTPLGTSFQQIADMTRADLNVSTGVLANLKNLEHGFEFEVDALPAEALSGKRRFDVVAHWRSGSTSDISRPQVVRCLCDGKPCGCSAGMVV